MADDTFDFECFATGVFPDMRGNEISFDTNALDELVANHAKLAPTTYPKSNWAMGRS